MKKIIYSAVICLFMYLPLAGQSQLGGGLFLVTDDVFDLGIDARGTYQFNDNWRGSLVLSFFFPDKEEFILPGIVGVNTVEIKSSAFSLSAEMNYLFTDIDLDDILIYGIGGLNYTSVSVDVENNNSNFGTAGIGASSDGISLVLGGGADFDFGKAFIPFAELKYIAGEANYAALVAGVRFSVGQ
jgi:opacity protein-like surface antigen